MINMEKFLNQHDLVYDKPSDRWLDGIPLANGDIGAMIWGTGAPLTITLDKHDTWDTRYQTHDFNNWNFTDLRELVEKGCFDEARDKYQPNYNSKGLIEPTRLPLPRITIDFEESADEFNARLSLHDAFVSGRLGFSQGEVDWTSYVHSEKNLFILTMSLNGNKKLPSIKIYDGHFDDPSVGFDQAKNAETVRDILTKFGYPKPIMVDSDTLSTYYQEYPEGGGYAIALKKVIENNCLTVYVSIQSSNDSASPLELAVETVEAAAKSGIDTLKKEHVKFWHSYWQKSFLSIPDSKMENLYYVEMYKLGCCSRENKLPITLQGLWTFGEGGMPPWNGDYHFDMNVQESYWPVYTSNHLEAGLPLYDMLIKSLPVFIQACKDYYHVDGAYVRCAAGPYGVPIQGYYTVDATNMCGAWIAHHFWLHWLYSQDKVFLREKAYPFMQPIMRAYLNLVEKWDDGKYHLSLSTSPEYEEDQPGAWGADTTCDIELMQWLASTLIEIVKILGIEDEDELRWRDLLDNLIELPQNAEQGLFVYKNQPLDHSHRHHSHLMSIYPLGTLNIEGSDEDKALIETSMYHLRKMGTGSWTGWSFPWASLIASRIKHSHMAWKMLEDYFCFIRPNTLHINGDPRKHGVSIATYEPMTLEAGFCYAAALMEMLMQSWDGIIRVFPSIPDFWHDAYFKDLRTEGAFLVTANLSDMQVVFIEIKSEVGGVCKVLNPFNTNAVLVDLKTKKQSVINGNILSFDTEQCGSYRLYSVEVSLSEEDFTKVMPCKPESECNWFGVKQLPRF